VRHVITIDGVEYDANAAMVLVANCGEVIPPGAPAGGIRPDDGLLDVVVMRANSFGQSVRAVWELLREPALGEGDDSFVGYATGRRSGWRAIRSSRCSSTASRGLTPFTATVVPGRSGSWRCRSHGAGGGTV
jgi:hypothetical protein